MESTESSEYVILKVSSCCAKIIARISDFVMTQLSDRVSFLSWDPDKTVAEPRIDIMSNVIDRILLLSVLQCHQ